MLNNILKIITSQKFYLPFFLIIIGIIVYKIISKTIIRLNKINKQIVKNHSVVYDKKRSTVIGLINNIIKYTIATIIIISILNIYGVNTSSIIASIGIVGAVIGLAFQDIIKDFLAGIFIIFDNAYAVGDWIKVGDFKGEVISVGLKTTKIRSYTGEIMILSNSSFNQVINYNLNPPKVLIQIPFSYEEDITKIENTIDKVLTSLKEDKRVKKADLLGVESFEESCIHYSVLIECVFGEHFNIKRKFLRDIKIAFDEEKISIPYNQLDVHIEK